MNGKIKYMGSVSGEALLAGLNSGGSPGQKPTHTQDMDWHYITPSRFDLAVRSVQMKGQVVGKLMTRCRCEGFTNHAERVEIAEAIQRMFSEIICVRPNCKLAMRPDEVYNSNLVPMIFYCGGEEFSILQDSLTTDGPSVLPEKLWRVVKGRLRAMTLNSSFKSNDQTMMEIRAGRHYTQIIR